METQAALPTLAVVIPTWNEAERLPRLLSRLVGRGAGSSEHPSAARSAPGSGRPASDGRGSAADRSSGLPGDPLDRADEVIVADGASDDGTQALARRAGVTLIEAARGRGTQLAAGARASSAAVLLFLHADCIPEPGSLAAVRRAFSDPDVGWSAMPQRILGSGRFYRWVERAANRRARSGCVYGDSGMAVRRSLYDRAGGFADLPLFEDVEISRRLRRLAPVHWVDQSCLGVSPRRWEREGRLRCTLRNRWLRMAFDLGVPAHRLAGRYAPHGSS